MKYLLYIISGCSLVLASCNKVIDLYPQSNLNTGTYYTNFEEVTAALNGCYSGMQAPLNTEWQLTELRSDVARQGVTGSTSSSNRDLSDLDMYIPATTQASIYQYWQDTYFNIRNANIILSKLGVEYNRAAGTLTKNTIDLPITDVDQKSLAGQAMFIRAYHYFNLVRLYGGVFLLDVPVSAEEAKTINRSSVEDIYKLIVADLQTASSYLSTAKFSQIAAADKGKANAWAAKALLAKVYLTLNRKADAITQLQDVITNSGYALQSSYDNIFSTSNELNNEILFAVRFKAGGVGLGSRFGNDFGPLNSGSAVINGSGLGFNTPTTQLDTAYIVTDKRRAKNIAKYGSGASERIYTPKYLAPVVITNDGESDWPIIRYADVLLMMAEAKGNTAEGLGYLNQVHKRALGVDLASMATVAEFEQAYSKERMLELAFENHRLFDLVRYNSTLTTIKAVETIRAHYAYEYLAHYSTYIPPTPTLAELQASVTAERLLLPIPQHEIDTNTRLVIAQNPGY